jgi:hypothetical protein
VLSLSAPYREDIACLMRAKSLTAEDVVATGIYGLGAHRRREPGNEGFRGSLDGDGLDNDGLDGDGPDGNGGSSAGPGNSGPGGNGPDGNGESSAGSGNNGLDGDGPGGNGGRAGREVFA